MYTWNFDNTADIWNYGVFNTVDECIKEAKKGYDVKSSDVIYVGEVQEFEPHVNATIILDQLETDAYEECGEVADDWYTYNFVNRSDRDKLNELSNKLTEIVVQWLKDNNKYPDFYKIVNIREIRID